MSPGSCDLAGHACPQTILVNPCLEIILASRNTWWFRSRHMTFPFAKSGVLKCCFRNLFSLLWVFHLAQLCLMLLGNTPRNCKKAEIFQIQFWLSKLKFWNPPVFISQTIETAAKCVTCLPKTINVHYIVNKSQSFFPHLNIRNSVCGPDSQREINSYLAVCTLPPQHEKSHLPDEFIILYKSCASRLNWRTSWLTIHHDKASLLFSHAEPHYCLHTRAWGFQGFPCKCSTPPRLLQWQMLRNLSAGWGAWGTFAAPNTQKPTVKIV